MGILTMAPPIVLMILYVNYRIQRSMGILCKLAVEPIILCLSMIMEKYMDGAKININKLITAKTWQFQYQK